RQAARGAPARRAPAGRAPARRAPVRRAGGRPARLLLRPGLAGGRLGGAGRALAARGRVGGRRRRRAALRGGGGLAALRHLPARALEDDPGCVQHLADLAAAGRADLDRLLAEALLALEALAAGQALVLVGWHPVRFPNV